MTDPRRGARAGPADEESPRPKNSRPHTVKPPARRLEEGGSPPTKTKIISSRRPAPIAGRPPPPFSSPPTAATPPSRLGTDPLAAPARAHTPPAPRPPRAPGLRAAAGGPGRPPARSASAPAPPPPPPPPPSPPPSARARRGSFAPPCLCVDQGRPSRSRRAPLRLEPRTSPPNRRAEESRDPALGCAGRRRRRGCSLRSGSGEDCLRLLFLLPP